LNRGSEKGAGGADPSIQPGTALTGIAPVRWDTDRLILLDQTLLPEREVDRGYQSWQEVGAAIRTLVVRGAPAIGVAAAFGVVLAARESRAGTFDGLMADLETAIKGLAATRPTAVNLFWALDRMRRAAVASSALTPDEVRARLLAEAQAIRDEDITANRAMGAHGASLVPPNARILTHCNAGWLATVDWGTALAPIYKAFNAGIPIHVWVDETRPRNQGASLTAWELGHHGVPHTVIVDNAGGHLMQHGLVDLCIVGSDRTTASGDVANKIGTYLKALAARDNGVPFYVALPVSTIDWTIENGVRDIPIEKRAPEELTHISGEADNGDVRTVRLTPKDSPAANYAFDVTPRHLVSALITERGVFRPIAEEMAELRRRVEESSAREAGPEKLEFRI